MDKIDRLGWADGMSFTSYGVRVGVRVNDSAILSDLIARLPPGSKPATFAVVDHLYSIIGSSARRVVLTLAIGTCSGLRGQENLTACSRLSNLMCS